MGFSQSQLAGFGCSWLDVIAIAAAAVVGDNRYRKS